MEEAAAHEELMDQLKKVLEEKDEVVAQKEKEITYLQEALEAKEMEMLDNPQINQD